MSESDLIIENRRYVHRGAYSSEPEYFYDHDDDSDNIINLSIAGQESIAKAENILAGIEGGFEKALQSTMKRVSSRLQTNSAKAIRERYAISAANIREHSRVQVSYDYENGVQAYVRFSGTLIPLYRFDGASPSQPTKDTSKRVPVAVNENYWRLMHPSVPATGHVLKGTSPYHFERAFVARMTHSTKHVGIFRRTGGVTSRDKDEIAELFGPSVASMLDNESVKKNLVDNAMQGFEKDLDHSVMAILSGYMG